MTKQEDIRDELWNLLGACLTESGCGGMDG